MLHRQRSTRPLRHHNTFSDILEVFHLTWETKTVAKNTEYIKLLPLHSSDSSRSSSQDMSLSSSSPVSPTCSSSRTLLTIPPELLLQILTHLPSSSSLHALSLTSRTLNTFVHTHAATITNSLVSFHHPKSSQILKAHHTENSAGFIVPTHPLVLAEERRIQRDKILASGCHCLPCRLMLHAGTSSSSDLSLRSSSEHDGLVGACLPAQSMVSTRGNECKARAALEKTVKLTEPGPQFLVFLERYGWEVEARWDIFVKQQHQTVKEEEEDVEETRAGDNGEEQKKKTFDFMIGNYCVRRFLEDTEKELTNFSTATKKAISPTLTIKERLRAKMNKHHQEKREKRRGAEAASRPPAARMFGEIEKTPTTTAVERDSWMKGLTWYHGSKYILDHEQVMADPVTGSDETMKTKSKQKTRNCIGGVKRGMRRVGSRIGSMFRRLRCVGDFQSLDD
ncbi:uncharacterized protein LY89DRAFT_722207 [Mollisia scopiformis]|uniref:F-box domain-containing protein n=1 Tax=Mollisia scopiformis TaxID=149040 RepID=A0A194WYG5_MOLSC|nr:uncharacterized protein LY89DRAFT_722207 [Mollisia scopiformis]KUJ12652.1 hypothetical protein LY89DRAFT_722207 [Mollisia scopiformis]